MKTDIHYYPQHTGYSCGPVCLRMVFKHLGRSYSEEQLIALCDTVPRQGTSHRHLINEVHQEGFACQEHLRGTVNYLIQCLESGYLPIVNFLNPLSGCGHYSIANGYDTEHNLLIFSDPKNGKDFSMEYSAFMTTWHNKKHSSIGWSLIIGRESIKLS